DLAKSVDDPKKLQQNLDQFVAGKLLILGRRLVERKDPTAVKVLDEAMTLDPANEQLKETRDAASAAEAEPKAATQLPPPDSVPLIASLSLRSRNMKRLFPAAITAMLLSFAAAADFPPVDQLPVRPEFPDPLVMLDGTRVMTKEQWETKRKPELKA